MSMEKLAYVAIGDAQALNVGWHDGHKAGVDLSAIIASRKNLAPLANTAEFAKGSLSEDGWSVEWPCGIDFGAQQLRRWADEQAGETMPALAFRQWMEHHKLTLDYAAEALGLSRRMIAYYLSGEQPVPKTVMLATEGYDHRRAA